MSILIIYNEDAEYDIHFDFDDTKLSFLTLFNSPWKKNEKCQQRGAPQMPGTML